MEFYTCESRDGGTTSWRVNWVWRRCGFTLFTNIHCASSGHEIIRSKLHSRTWESSSFQFVYLRGRWQSIRPRMLCLLLHPNSTSYFQVDPCQHVDWSLMTYHLIQRSYNFPCIHAVLYRSLHCSWTRNHFAAGDNWTLRTYGTHARSLRLGACL